MVYNANRAPVAQVQLVGYPADNTISETQGNKTSLYTHNTETAEIHYAKGEATGVTIERKFGANLTVGTSYEAIWAESSNYNFPSAGQVITISSGSATDTAASSGASRVEIRGLRTSAFTEFTTTVTMSGQTGATAATDVYRIQRMSVVACSGASSIVNTTVSNNGIIYAGYGTITAGKPANVLGHVAIGEGQTQQCVFTVPGGKTFYLEQIYFSVESGKVATVRLMARDNVIPKDPFSNKFALSGTGQIFALPFEVPRKFTEKTDILLQGKAASQTQAIYGGFSGILFTNGI